MTDINRVVLIGRLTRDLGSDERSWGYLPNGQARANVSIAVNRSSKQGEEWVDEVNYFDVTIFGKTAENLKSYLLKGKQVGVEGHLKQERWKDLQGNNRSRVVILADNIQLLGGKNDSDSSSMQAGGYQSSFKPASNRYSGQAAAQKKEYKNDCEAFPEDIPF